MQTRILLVTDTRDNMFVRLQSVTTFGSAVVTILILFKIALRLEWPVLMRFIDYHEAGLCCYLVIHIETYYVHYSCFTSICDLFTASPSYYEAIYLCKICM
jgi:hypothetical protein